MWVTALANKRSHYTSQRREEEEEERERERERDMTRLGIQQFAAAQSWLLITRKSTPISRNAPSDTSYVLFKALVLPVNTGKQAPAILLLMYRLM